MCYWREGVGPWMAVGGVLMFLFWAGVVGLAVWAFSKFTKHSQKENGALAVVRERYARGELGKEEYDRIKKDMS